MDFIDVPGASGAQYRYRRATLEALPATAGNIVAVVGSPARRRFLLCAAARSLVRARPHLEAVLRENRTATLFIRLNVARESREAEHADIVAAVAPAADVPDLE
jgi:hypothetical protein